MTFLTQTVGVQLYNVNNSAKCKCNFIGWMRSVKMIEHIDILMAMQMQQTLFNDVILVENNVP